MGLLTLLAVILCVVLGFAIRRGRKPEPEVWDDGLVREASAVVYDFLEAGRAVSLLTEGKYRGTISVRPSPRAGDRVGFLISMYDSGDLRQSFADYQRGHGELIARERSSFLELTHFIEKYGGCYDPARDALVYPTENAVANTQKREAEALLFDKICRHPQAQLEALSHIATKDL